ncbi:hypothetical protein [Paracoccus versutus]
MTDDPLILRQISEGRDRRRAYLHIGKTGGTTFRAAAERVAAAEPFRVPLIFHHDWTVPRIRAAFPGIRISFVLRDPLERIVSGFMSRLRQGRPTYQSPWTVEEATAFLHFRDARAYLDAILSGGEYEMSAVDFATRSIAHIRRGYRFHIPNTATASKWLGSVGTLASLEGFAQKLLGGPVELGHAHVNPVPARDILKHYGADELDRLRRHFADEYQVFNAMMQAAEP